MLRAPSVVFLCLVASACGNSSLPNGSGGTAPPAVVPSPPIGGTTLLSAPGRCAPTVSIPQTKITIPNLGITLSPVGRLTKVGNLPTGGAVTPDGKQYWAVDSGFGLNDIKIVDISSGAVLQTLPLPGAYGGMVFSPDGLKAYVSGEPVGSGNAVAPSGLMGTAGDVVHVFKRDPATGVATEQPPLTLPSTIGGSGRTNSLPPAPNGVAWPVGIAISPDGKTLVVALNSADSAALINLTADGLSAASTSSVTAGKYPYGATIERTGKYAYVSNELDGTLTQITLAAGPAGNATATIAGLGGAGGDAGSHPQNLLADPKADRLYVAVTNNDGVAVVDTATNTLLKFISLARPEGPGAAPVALALAPDQSSLYVADAGENAIAAIALTDRPDGSFKAYDVIGKIPTTDYPHDVQLTPDGCTLVWSSARGLGAGSNPGYLQFSFGPPSPYPAYLPTLLTGQVGVLPTPADSFFASSKKGVDLAVVPGDGSGNRPSAPPNTPVHGALQADGSYAPSGQIQYVFYVIRENRTYDQIFGSDPRGNGNPAYELFDDNGVAGAVGGVTPNAHALSRQFVLLDNFFEDSEVSVDGHLLVQTAYATDYVTKAIHANYSGRGKPYDFGLFPITEPPKGFLFDAAVNKGITFRNYGEAAFGTIPSNARATVQPQVAANTNAAYPNDAMIGCTGTATGAPNSPQCVFDSGLSGTPAAALSRIDVFNRDFTAQLQAGNVPKLNYLVMTNDHTQGVTASGRDPMAMVADNDRGVGQLVQLISNSSIWSKSVIFIVEDDSQDGQDHVDAHRAPAFVIGPYVKRGGQLIHTHYDQYSVIHTIELILGLPTMSIHDANAPPMYDVFTEAADTTKYSFIEPTKNILALCPCANVSKSAEAFGPGGGVSALP